MGIVNIYGRELSGAAARTGNFNKKEEYIILKREALRCMKKICTTRTEIQATNSVM